MRVLSQKLGGLPVLATAATAAACRLDGPVAFETFEAGGRFQAAGMELTAFSLPHDAADPVGLVVANHSARLGVATDLGKPTALVKNRLAGCGALVLECNHDPGLLANGPYPPGSSSGWPRATATSPTSRGPSCWPSCTTRACARWCWPTCQRLTTPPPWRRPGRPIAWDVSAPGPPWRWPGSTVPPR